jgi:VIT1/CCC1 family predicted Fe2+/Mn2+ transporter
MLYNAVAGFTGMNPKKLHEITDRHMAAEAAARTNTGDLLRQVILGGQDGLVNVLGILLGVAKATGSAPTVIVAGLAATFAESISMGAVAYTSSQAARDFYFRELEREKKEMKTLPEIEKEEVKVIYMRKGFRGKALDAIVRKTVSNDKMWLDLMMAEELGFSENDAKVNPLREAFVVMMSAFAGSFIPLLPFFFLPIGTATIVSVGVAVITLFAAGAIKGKLTTGNLFWRGVELSLIGTVAALAGYAVGAIFKVTV